MSSAPLKTALKHVGGWTTVVGFVVLLTLIFSFLGTLFCAALGGTMMGAVKTSKLLSIPFSALCPGVLYAVLRAQKSELPARQIATLMVICFITFWAIYLMTALLAAYERRGSAATTQAAAAGASGSSEVTTAAAAGAPAEARPSEAAVIPTPLPVPDLRLEELDGTWRCEICGADGRLLKRLLEIKDGDLVLRTLDANGSVCSCARARLELVHLTGARVLTVASETPAAAINYSV